MIKKIIYILIITIIALGACKKQNPKKLSEEDIKQIKIDIQEIITAVPTPDYILANKDEYLKYYNPQILNPKVNIIKYNTKEQQAINLGVYLADLAYVTAFNDKEYQKQYIAVARKLNQLLGFEQIITDSLEEFLIQNINNPQLLFLFMQQAYNQLIIQFYEHNQLDLATLTLIGAWIESYYLLLKLILEQTTQTDFLITLANEQRQTLDNLINILEKIKNSSEYYNYLYTELIDLQGLFDISSNPLTFSDIERLLIRVELIRNYLIQTN